MRPMLRTEFGYNVGMVTRIAVSLEIAPKRTMASVIAWPGWCRGAKTEADALAALAAYGPRYGKVIRGVAKDVPGATDVRKLVVKERLAGGAGTEFGVPNLPLLGDDRPLDDAELQRLTAILQASWRAFDRAAERADGIELTKGPRGGGRDLDKIVGHVSEAEAAYVLQVGSRPPKGDHGSPELMAAIRTAGVAALAERAHGEEPENASNVKHRWLPRYFVRRSAWHVLDHLWEIEDRAGL